MFKSLILSVFLSSSVGVCASQPVCAAQPQQVITRDSTPTTTNNDSDTTLYYKKPKYETNEVNSNADLVVGNVYDFDFNSSKTGWENESIFDYYQEEIIFEDIKLVSSLVVGLSYGTNDLDIRDDYSFLSMYLDTSTGNGDFYIVFNNLFVDIILEFDIDNPSNNELHLSFVYSEGIFADSSVNVSPWITVSSYQEYEYIAVPNTHNSNLYTLIYDFYNGLFNSTGLDAVTFSIGNSNMSMNVWLSHTLTIITLFAFIFVLFLLLKWLFKVVSNLILLKN